jgi:uncharacterized protein YjbI with pentapeptide repeats
MTSYMSPDEDLSRWLRESRLWRDSQGREGQTLSFYQEELRNLDLRGMVLAGGSIVETVFEDCLLDDADFGAALAGGVTIRRSSAQRSIFWKANLCEAILTNVDFSRSSFVKANMRGANIEGAQMRGADLTHSEMTLVRARRADLSDADLAYAWLDGADFSEASLAGARLERTLVSSETKLAAADIVRAEIVSIFLEGALIEGLDARRTLERFVRE